MANQVIYKYPVEPIRLKFVHMIPKGAEVLCVQMQNDAPQMWVLVDPDAEMERREFIRVGTGWEHKKTSKSQYVGTYQELPFVWHIFEV